MLSTIVEERISGVSSNTIRFYHGVGIDEMLGRSDSVGVVTFNLVDHLGTVVQESGSTGVIVLNRESDPWGNPVVGGGVSGAAFTGREYDAETGLLYYRSRYLSPNLGRFVNEDPLSVQKRPSSEMNNFAYVANDPANSTDPSGLQQCKCPDVPNAPPGVSCPANVAKTKVVESPLWWYEQVKNGGSFDYKQQGREYEDFGNFNYGATGRATGFSAQVLKRAAGYAQSRSGNWDPKDGHFWGSAPYGDDPKDQAMIIKGIEYYECGCWKR